MADGVPQLSSGLQQLAGRGYGGAGYTQIPIRAGYAYPSSLGENAQQSQGTNQSVAQAHSDSFIPDYSQTPILERIAQEAEGMAPQIYQWGMDQFNKNQGNIDDLMRQGKMWASPQHISTMMGQAEAGVQQAGEQARASALQDLQSYGVDPSAGRYAALDQASRVQTAAAAAGAGNQQRQADIAQGLTMQNQAISAGMQNTQTGYGAANAMNSLYGTGMQLKYPPLGTTSASGTVSSGQQTSAGGGFNVGFSGAGAGAGAGAGGGISPGTQNANLWAGWNKQPSANMMAAKGGYVDRDHIEHPDGYQDGGEVDPVQDAIERQAGMSQSEINKQRRKEQPGYQGGGSVEDALGAQDVGIGLGIPSAPIGARGGISQTPGVPYLEDILQEQAKERKRRGYQDGGEVGGALAAQDVGIGLGIPSAPIGARGGISPTPGVPYLEDVLKPRKRQDDGYAGGGVVGTTSPGFNPSGPVGGAPIGSPTLTSGVAGGMAHGGPVDPTTGGFVSQALSPSNGKQTDDVPARLNEGEYVIPRDVVHWRGKEFFHKLIAQSRKNRETHQRSFFGGGGVQSYGQTT